MRELLAALANNDPDAMAACTPITGHSHRIYRHGDVVIKILERKHGDEPDREWNSLTFLDDVGFTWSPRPIARHGDAIAMTWCEGSAPGPSSSDESWMELARVQRELYALTPHDGMTLSRSDPRVSVTRIARYSSEIGEDPRWVEAARWLASNEPALLLDADASSFTRCDGGLRNYLWDGRHVWVVDFEDAGRGNWVADLAELIEHVQSRDLPDDHWERFSRFFDPPQELFLAARRAAAIFWLAIFMRRGDDRADMQRARVCDLLT